MIYLDINPSVVKYFKIEKNTSTVLYLTDDDSELITGTYTYFIDFILCRVKPASFKYNQQVFKYSNDTSKSAYSITFEDID